MGSDFWPCTCSKISSSKIKSPQRETFAYTETHGKKKKKKKEKMRRETRRQREQRWRTASDKKQFVRFSIGLNGRKRCRRVNRVVCAEGLRVRSPDRGFPIVLNTGLTTTVCTRIPRVLFRTLNYSNVGTACVRACVRACAWRYLWWRRRRRRRERDGRRKREETSMAIL